MATVGIKRLNPEVESKIDLPQFPVC